jgi:hypothetical protein
MSEYQNLKVFQFIKESVDKIQKVNTDATFQKIEKNNLINSENLTDNNNIKTSFKMDPLSNSVNSLDLNASNLNTVNNEVYVTPANVDTLTLPSLPVTNVQKIPLTLPTNIIVPTANVPMMFTTSAPTVTSTPMSNAVSSNYTREQLTGMKKPDLEAILLKMNKKKSGNKPDLIDRILGISNTPQMQGNVSVEKIGTATLPLLATNNFVVTDMNSSSVPVPSANVGAMGVPMGITVPVMPMSMAAPNGQTSLTAPMVNPVIPSAINPASPVLNVAGMHKYTKEELESKTMKKENLQAILVALKSKKKTGNKPELVEMILKLQASLGM